METIKLTDIQPSEYNPRVITPTQFQRLENSIEKFGFVDPIIIDINTNTIIGGHQRYKALVKKGINDLYLIKLGDIGWCFPDKEITLPQKGATQKALNIALNSISAEWDETALASLVDDIDLSFIDTVLPTSFNLDKTVPKPAPAPEKKANPDISYKIKPPSLQYTPKDNPPSITELVDERTTIRILNDIGKSNLPEEVKHFLKLASYRFLAFDYEKIADYYANSDKETQEQFEKQLLVLVDTADKLQKSYINLSKSVLEMIQ